MPVEGEWTVLPFPFDLVATPPPDPCALPYWREMPATLTRLMEDAAGLAGVLAAAAAQPETDQDDVTYALRLLAEHLHATVALWRQWRAQVEPETEA